MIINDSFSVIDNDLILNWLIYIMLYLYKFIDKMITIIEYIIKYIIHNFLYIMAHAINHLIWLIDEYAIIFCIDVWFSPKIAPKIADKIMIVIVIFLFSILWDIMYMGAIFCHVINIIHEFHLNFDINSGNHIWNGGIPIFIIIVIIITILIIVLFFIFKKINVFIKINNMKIIDAILCIKKYIILL